MKHIHTTSHRNSKRKAYYILAVLLFSFITAYANSPEDNTYPTAERLFHIARSLNKNLVCYDVNLENGKLNVQSPLNIYWVNREERPGETDGLNFFQKKMAYGYKLVAKGDDYSEVTLTAYAGKTLKICKLNKKYVCTTTINGQLAILQSLYVQCKPGNPLSVEYVELQGVSIDTGTPVSEKVKK